MGVKASKLSRVVSFRNLKRLRCPGPSPSPSLVTRRGYIPVTVGMDEETKTFMVHRRTFSNAEFVQFLWRSAEEYGFSNEGILRIPYDAKAFEEWISRSPKTRIFRIQPTTT